MENQAENQQQETHGKTTNHMNNKGTKQKNTKELVSPKTGLLA